MTTTEIIVREARVTHGAHYGECQECGAGSDCDAPAAKVVTWTSQLYGSVDLCDKCQIKLEVK